MDKIKIKNLEVFANHGVFPEETKLGQKFLIDAVLYTDTRTAGIRDCIEESIHYGEVSHFITEFMREHTYQLIETVAEQLAKAMLLQIPRLEKVTLEIKKPWAPIGLPLEEVSVEITRGWHTVYLSFGSNMGEKENYIQNGIKELNQHECCIVEQVSPLLETEPYGGVEQDNFLNGCLKMRTLLTPQELLELLHEIEANAGRERLIHWGPRTLDLDILFYDRELIEEDDLVIPHIDMQNRRFVLEPLAQIAPNFRHPILKKTVREMLDEHNFI